MCTRNARAYTITLTPVGDSFPATPDETLLAAILRSGARVFYGCRGGGCGTCKMRVTRGTVDHGRCSTAALTEAEKDAGFVLSCQARPQSDLTIALTDANRYRVSTRLGFQHFHVTDKEIPS